MAIYKRFSPNIFSGFWVAVMITLWLAFAPAQAGGMASYIIVIGNSMEPNFHIGDLVIVHEEADYEIGDAVVYQNLELKNFVFHRIIAEQMGRFTLRGDNNSWTDTYMPSQEEVLGKLWLHIPKGGNVIQKIRTPIGMAVIAGVLGGFLATGFFTNKRKGRKRMDNKPKQAWFTSFKQKMQGWFARSNAPESQKSPNSNNGPLLEGLFFGLGLVALASLIIGIISFSRPATRLVNDDISYDQLGFFAYTAPAPQDVYDANTIQSGDPIFTKLTCSVDVAFQYTLVAQQAENISGTHQLTATIFEQTNGWERTVPLQEKATFSGTSFDTNAKLDLCRIEKLTQSMEQGTDFRPGSYTLSISPNVKVDGNIAGRVLQSTFNTGPEFRYDRIQFYLLSDEERGSLLNVTKSGNLSEEQTVANTMRLFGTELAIPALRLIAIIGLIGSLIGVAVLGISMQNLSQSEPAKYIQTRYSSMMIDIQNADTINSSTFVDVSSIDDLGKLAERFNAMILHAEFSKSHAYYVQDEGTTYRFVMNRQETETAVPANDAGSQGGES